MNRQLSVFVWMVHSSHWSKSTLAKQANVWYARLPVKPWWALKVEGSGLGRNPVTHGFELVGLENQLAVTDRPSGM